MLIPTIPGARAWLQGAGCCALGCLPACGDASPAQEERPNVLLISIDSLRADHLGAYGYGRETSPRIDALAAQGALFGKTMSSTSWTLPAHASLFTGLPIAGHGCHSKRTKLRDGAETLAESLRASGYATAGFWSGPYLHPVYGLSQGFDEYVNCANFGYFEEREKGAQRRANQQSHEDVTNPKLTGAVLDWMEARRLSEAANPFFLFVHMWDVHYDFFPPAPYDTMFSGDYRGEVDGTSMRKLPGAELTQAGRDHTRALYDGEIAWTDMHVGRILDKLVACGWEEDTLVILTADHGEEFWERGNFGHRKTLFEESIRIPLVMRYPGRIAPGTRVDAVTSIVDVAPTILQWAGLSASLRDDGLAGISLVPRLGGAGADAERWIFAELHRPKSGASRVALRSQDWKLLYNPDNDALIGVWELASDGVEQDNRLAGDSALSAEKLAAARAAYESLRALEREDPLQGSGTGSTSQVPEDVSHALHQLGYTGDDSDDELDEEQ